MTSAQVWSLLCVCERISGSGWVAMLCPGPLIRLVWSKIKWVWTGMVMLMQIGSGRGPVVPI